MKITVIAAFLLILVPIGKAQTRGSLADQQACYQQARQFVGNKTADQSKINIWTGEPAEPYRFEQAHYDAKSKVCYVDYSHIEFSTAGEHRQYVMQYFVADAFEGNMLANLTMMVDTRNGYEEHVSEGGCIVNADKCSTHAGYNGLLWSFIPAFKPVDAQKK